LVIGIASVAAPQSAKVVVATFATIKCVGRSLVLAPFQPFRHLRPMLAVKATADHTEPAALPMVRPYHLDS
jgi:hypothetical protein